MFYHSIWDPGLIISQIIFLQAIFYFSLGFWLILWNFIFQSNALLFLIFSDSAINLSNLSGSAPTFFAFLFTLPLVAVAVFLIVGRAKKCLDFCCTLYGFHFLFCWSIESWPHRWEFWIFHIFCLICLTLASEFLCIRQELKWIPIGGESRDRSKSTDRRVETEEVEMESVSLLGGNRRNLQPREIQISPQNQIRGINLV